MTRQGDKDAWNEGTVDMGKCDTILTTTMAVLVGNLDYAKGKQQWWVQKKNHTNY